MVNNGLKLADYTWHCLYVPPQRELIAGHDLSASGYPVIIPAEKRWEDKSGHTRVTYKPVMPRYVFTGFKEAPNFERVRELVPLVHGYLQFGYGPTQLQLVDVRWLSELQETLRNRKRQVQPDIQVGDNVTVLHGPLTGKSIRVDKVVAKRIHTITQMLGAPRLIKLDLASVARIG